MHILAHVLFEAWNALPASVLEDRDLTGVDGLPKKTVREYLLAGLTSLRRAKLVGNTQVVQLDDDEARRLVADVTAGAAQLVDIVAWLQTIRASGAIPNVEPRLKAARDLAGERPGERAHLSEAQASDVVRRLVGGSPRATLTAKDLRVVATATNAKARAEAARLTDRIATVWTQRTTTTAEPDWARAPSKDDRAAAREQLQPQRMTDLLRYGLPLAFVGFSGFEGGVPSASAESAWVWARLVAQPPVPGPSTALSLGLLRSLPPKRPDLTGRLPGAARPDNGPEAGEGAQDQIAADSAGEVEVDEALAPAAYPLDSHIHARLLRAVRALGPTGADDLTGARAFELAIDASVRPLGLPYDWADAIMAIGGAVAGLMTWAQASPAEREHAAALPGGAATVRSGWVREVEKVRKRGDRALRADVIELYQNPTSWYLGRLWNRVLRQCLVSAEAPTADIVWSHVYGAFTSTRKQLSTLAGAGESDGVINEVVDGADEGVGVDPLDRAACEEATDESPAPSEPFLDVLRLAAERGEGDRVLRFWNDVAALAGPEPDPRALVAVWEGWVATYLRAYPREDGAFRPRNHAEVVFAIARLEITMRGPLDQPTSGISTTEVAGKGIES